MPFGLEITEETRDIVHAQFEAKTRERDLLCRRLAKLCGIGIGFDGEPFSVFDACVAAPKCLRETERKELIEQIRAQTREIEELAKAIE